MIYDSTKLCVRIITNGSDDAIELVTRFVNLRRSFQNELRNHMDSKLEVARLKAENEFLLRAIEESSQSE